MTNDVPTLVARAREAQREWAARPIAERAELVGAMRRWLVANRDRVVESTMRETGKTYEDAVMNEVFVVASALRFWEKKSEGYLKDERVAARSPMVLGRKFIVRRRPLGVVGVIAPWNYPLGTGLVDAVPALMAGNAVRAQAVGRDAAHHQDGGRGLRARGRPARGRAAGGHGPRRHRRRARGPRGHGHVHRLHAHRPQGRGAGSRAPDTRLARDGRQGPDDRLRRRRPRPRRQRGRDDGSPQQRADLPLGRAHLRRGRGARPVRREARDRGRPAAAARDHVGGRGRRRRR